ncbi:MAG: anhydro-N-acetylmuramic acid kinase [Phycisphaerales bacterium]|nr:anhydro-N-acetylmuramic acid kinase [Phycisphaerales bacterium]
MTPTRHVIGIMTGTSLDGIDATLVQIKGRGLDLKAQSIKHCSAPLGEATDTLRKLAAGDSLNASAWAQAGLELAQSCLTIAREVANGAKPDLVAVHGQTVHHEPPCSIQWINPAPIAHGMKCPVVHDLRGGDLAAGGQGAPITPLADWIMFRAPDPVTVINLGGFCNVTHLPADLEGAASIESIKARDVCPCNHLLDMAARKLIDHDFDMGGKTASSGRCDNNIARQIQERLTDASSSGRSLGSGDEGHDALEPLWKIEQPADALATLVRAIACCIIESVPDGQKRILLAGGGALNKALVDSITAEADGSVALTDAVGTGVQSREAAAMAILGTLAMDGIPITLPGVTGTSEPTTFDGSWCLPRTLRPVEYT